LICVTYKDALQNHYNCYTHFLKTYIIAIFDVMPVNPIDKYLGDLPIEDRVALEKLRHTILKALPAAEEVISYGIPCFKIKGKAVVGFAAFKNHCTFFAWSGSVLSGLKKELAKFDHSKSGIHFTPKHPIPVSLVKKIIKIRLQENKLKEAKKIKK
jgi:uncharacterized protein YdhG (YjbR/CyaY superfamily)